MKKTIAAVGFCLLSVAAFAQTDIQLFYDFGHGREYFTSTLEMFKPDSWGNTFFFVDYDYNYTGIDSNGNDYVKSPSNTYFEIARGLNFWGDSWLAPVSIQIEYNGGFTGNAGWSAPITSAWLAGLDYTFHDATFSNTLSLQVLYRKFKKDTESIPLQFSAVWNMRDLFGLEGLQFSGFADFLGQNKPVVKDGNISEADWTFLSEPQLWYAVGRYFNCDNLNVGCEFEIGYNYSGNTLLVGGSSIAEKGFVCNPCVGLKWNF
ncbi:MAG: DUF5020 family protein [Bacteroidaceae bacterium]|nr:DUF5020 family protein [Bacteroidaceae bacterium]